MHEMPQDMLWDGASVEPEFPDDEPLYFRVPPDNIFSQNGKLRIDNAAVQLPDKSVNRSKRGGQAQFALHNVYRDCNGKCDGRHHAWTVARIEVKDISVQIYDQPEGVSFDTRPVHVPQRHNRFHSEIRAFDLQGQHIRRERLAELGLNAHLRWSLRVARYAQVVIAGDMRQD